MPLSLRACPDRPRARPCRRTRLGARNVAMAAQASQETRGEPGGAHGAPHGYHHAQSLEAGDANSSGRFTHFDAVFSDQTLGYHVNWNEDIQRLVIVGPTAGFLGSAPCPMEKLLLLLSFWPALINKGHRPRWVVGASFLTLARPGGAGNTVTSEPASEISPSV